MNRTSTLLLSFVLLALAPIEAPTCGPVFDTAVFVADDVPGVALADYNSGKLGVVRKSFRLQHLATAWRCLNGSPLPASAWTPRAERPVEQSWKAWLAGRAAVIEDKLPEYPEVFRQVPGSDWAQFVNCNGSAFENAQRTLEERIKSFGATNPEVKAWVKAQDTVFANCGKGVNIPPPPSPDLPPILQADRRYQIAAAHFYAAEFDAGRAAFLEISKDTTSPWQSLGRYLAARCLVRKGTLKPGEREVDAALLKQAEEELLDLARAAINPEIRAASLRLAGYVASRLRPAQQLVRTAKLLSSRSNDASFQENWASFRILMDSTRDRKDVIGANEMLDWLLAMRGDMPEEQVMEQWKKVKSEAWLVAALARVTPGKADAAQLLAAAANVAPDSPAYATVSYDRAHLLAGASEDERRSMLDQMIANLRDRQPASVLNPFLAERMPLAKTFDDFLRDAVRVPAALASYGYAPWPAHEPAALFDVDSMLVMHSSVPLLRWVKAAESDQLTSHLRSRFLRAAWVRAVLMADHDLARRLAPAVVRDYSGLAQPLKAYQEAASPEDREFAAVWTMLKAPGLQPFMRPNLDRSGQLHERSPFRDNWWCGAEYTTPKRDAPFLPAEERQQGAAEAYAITSKGAAGNYFAPVTIAWAQSHREDPRAAEALHLTVMATRFGCRDDATGQHSKEAFQTLHKLFPSSEWARKTPHWYAKDRP
jgi:hypothetical protein